MTCKRCRRATKVIWTTSFPGRTERTRECQCGIVFSTVEKLDRKSIRPSRGIVRLAVTEAMKILVFERDGYQCVYCQGQQDLVVDHFVPFVAPIEPGRSIEDETAFRNSVENMVCCCSSCNSGKGDSTHWVRGRKGAAVVQKEDQLGEDIDSGFDLSPDDPDSGPISLGDPERARVRGKGRAYSLEFESVWHSYGRRQEKARAYEAWKIAARAEGPEVLRDRILYALKWQGPIFAQEGWKYAPYLERYIKRAKWEDEPPPAATGQGIIRQARSPYCIFHRAFGSKGKLPREGAQAGCPECKHVAAATRVRRESEPTPLLSIVPATLEEIERARKESVGG